MVTTDKWIFNIGGPEDVTRRRVLAGMLGAGAAAAVAGCAPPIPYGAGGTMLPPETRPYPTRSEGIDTIPQIEHVIIYMQENHSYDQYFGALDHGDGFTMGADGLPTNWNPDGSGNPVRAFHQANTCDAISGDHSWTGTHRQINNGAMDGFARSSGPNVMGYFDQTNLPFYYGLANTFPLCDRWFASVPGPTHPNRRYLQAATSVGMINTDANEALSNPTAPNGTIWDRLDHWGITWKDYAIDVWDALLFPTADPVGFVFRNAAKLKYFGDFLNDCAAGTLPQVSIISPGTQDQYDEGSQDVQNGEAYSWAIMNAVMNGPKWGSSVILFCYDEHGGGYDHVPPPAAVAPDAIAPEVGPNDTPGTFAQYGVRVPGFVVSPWSRGQVSRADRFNRANVGATQSYVSHEVHDHTSILRFIETKWNLGALTYRDANASNLLDCFDFRAPTFATPPMLPSPGLPVTGSPCEPQPWPGGPRPA